MLKITIAGDQDLATLKLEGKLVGPWVHELERCWHTIRDNSDDRAVIVDLCDVTFVDAEGRKLLTWMCGQGAQFRTLGCMTKGIVEEIVQECGRPR